MLGFAGGAKLAAYLLPILGGNSGDPAAEIGAGVSGVLVIGPMTAVLGAMVGYQRGRTADFNRRTH